MIDLVALKAEIGEGAGEDVVQVDFTRSYVRQIILEIESGRLAVAECARAGQCFGLKPGVSL